MFRFFLFGFGEYGKAVFLRAFEPNVDQGGSKIFFPAVRSYVTDEEEQAMLAGEAGPGV